MLPPARFSSWILAGLPWVFSLILVNLASRKPEIVEVWYAQGFYAAVVSPWSRLISYLPFSLGELTLYILIAWLLLFLLRRLIRLVVRPITPPRRGLGLKIICGMGILYLAFLLIWGLNYYRVSWGESAGLDLSPPHDSEIIKLTRSLAYDANHQRSQIDPSALDDLNRNRNKILKNAALGYSRAAEDYPVLGQVWGSPKPIWLSQIQTRSGISGYYMPFTAEPNVNNDLPLPFYPAAAMHEVAHLHGFAREGEANYLAYLTCQYHPDPLFQYSGTLLAFVYAADSLYQISPQAYDQVISSLSAEVRQDIKNNHEFWSRYQGPLTTIADRINDIYLKANQQPGTVSYSQMVQLLIAHQRAIMVEADD